MVSLSNPFCELIINNNIQSVNNVQSVRIFILKFIVYKKSEYMKHMYEISAFKVSLIINKSSIAFRYTVHGKKIANTQACLYSHLVKNKPFLIYYHYAIDRQFFLRDIKDISAVTKSDVKDIGEIGTMKQAREENGNCLL